VLRKVHFVCVLFGVARHLRVLGRQFHVRVMMVWVRLHEFQVIVGALEDDSQGVSILYVLG
jgi:hypothetical protein